MSQPTIKITDKNGILKPHELKHQESLLSYKLQQHPSLIEELLKHTHELQFISDEPNKQISLTTQLPDAVRQSLVDKLELHPRQ